ncbi:hypothetical protein GmHk_10G028369 [Glycine max]|nr:hypothetical protein GmHk_10G028369 [Glycine max]
MIYHTKFDEFKTELERRNWHKELTNFLDGSIDAAIVKEFYASLYDPEDKSPKQVRVRGHLIKFDEDALNTFLKTPVIIEEGESLSAYSRARLISGIIQKMDMKLGYIISSQISMIAQHDSSQLGFPALITTLCKARGVTSDSLSFESLSPAINLAYVKKNCWNLDDPTVTFWGPHKAKGKRSEALPSSAFHTSAPSTSNAAPSTPASSVPALALASELVPEEDELIPPEPFVYETDPASAQEEVASPELIPQSSPTPVLDDPQPYALASVPDQPIVQDPPVALVLDLNEHAQDHSQDF